MTDNLTPRQRSQAMSRVRSTDTSPERRLRSIVHRLGYRFRLHRRDLPGRPDLVFPSRRKVIFVHGCFLASAPFLWESADSSDTTQVLAGEAVNQRHSRRAGEASTACQGLEGACALGVSTC